MLVIDYFNFNVLKTSPKIPKIAPKSEDAHITKKLGTKTADNPDLGLEINY